MLFAMPRLKNCQIGAAGNTQRLLGGKAEAHNYRPTGRITNSPRVCGSALGKGSAAVLGWLTAAGGAKNNADRGRGAFGSGVTGQVAIA